MSDSLTTAAKDTHAIATESITIERGGKCTVDKVTSSNITLRLNSPPTQQCHPSIIIICTCVHIDCQTETSSIEFEITDAHKQYKSKGLFYVGCQSHTFARSGSRVGWGF